jgi:hypothetical protein
MRKFEQFIITILATTGLIAIAVVIGVLLGGLISEIDIAPLLELFSFFLFGSDYLFTGTLDVDSSVYISEPIMDLNLFAENQGNMDLSSSSDLDSEPKYKVNQAIDMNEKLNPPSGEPKSSTLPQTEFEEKPYIENKPLPKSFSDHTSLGKELEK